MDWRCGSSGTAPALQACSPSANPSTAKNGEKASTFHFYLYLIFTDI
jgi:hypothetical protein